MKSQTTAIISIIVIALLIVIGYYGYVKFYNKPSVTPIQVNNTVKTESKYLIFEDIGVYYKNKEVTTLTNGLNNYTLSVRMKTNAGNYICKAKIYTQKETLFQGFKNIMQFTTNLNAAGEKVLFTITCDAGDLENYTTFTLEAKSPYKLDKVCSGKSNGDEVTGAIQGIPSNIPLFCYDGFPYKTARICNSEKCLGYTENYTPTITFKTKEKINEKNFEPYFDYVNLTGKYRKFILLKYNSIIPEEYCAYAKLGDGSDEYKYNFNYRNNGETNSTDYLTSGEGKYGYNNNSKYYCYNSSFYDRSLKYGCLGVFDRQTIESTTYTNSKNQSTFYYNVSKLQFRNYLNYTGCNVCNPKIDSTKLSLYTKGKVGEGLYCTSDGEIIKGCIIYGKLYKDKEFTGVCTICDANKKDNESSIADGVRSFNSLGVWCVKGKEVLGCNLGNGQIIQRSQDRTDFSCQTCFPIPRDPESDVQYSNKPDGTKCGPNNNLQCISGLCVSPPTLAFSINTYDNSTGTTIGVNSAFNTTGPVSIGLPAGSKLYSKISFNYYGKLPKKISELYSDNQTLTYYYDSKPYFYSQKKVYNNSYYYDNLLNITNYTCISQSDGTSQCYTEIPSMTVANTTTKTTLLLMFRNTLLMLNNNPYYFELLTNPIVGNCTNYTTIQNSNFNYGYTYSCINGIDSNVDVKGSCNLQKLSEFAPLCNVFPCKDDSGTKYYLVSENIYGPITKYPDFKGNYTIDKCETQDQCEALKSERRASVGCEDSILENNTFYAQCNSPINSLYKQNFKSKYCEKVIYTRDPLNH